MGVDESVMTEKTQATGTTHYRACNLCEAICGLEIKLDAGRITSIKGDKADPLSRGHICPKAIALQDIQEDPDRLRQPMRRDGDRWTPISWDEAFDLVVDKISQVQERYGNNAVATYMGNPSVHNYGIQTHASQFLGLLKTRSRFSATSVDQLPHQLIAHWMFGHQLLLPIPDIDRTQYFLVLGGNPIASNGSLMTVPDIRTRLKALKRRGGKLVVIDPRRTETAECADEHHFIRPGTDAALLAAMLNTIIHEGLSKPGPLSEHLEGWDAALAAVDMFTPERAAQVTGMDAETIRRLAREFAAADGAVCYGRLGLSTQAFGALCQWLIQLINIATGNLDRPGGALFTRPALDLVGGPNSKPGHYGRWHSRVRGLPEFSGELPAAAMAEEMLTPGEGQIHALITVAGNPVLSTPNGRQLDKALEQLDFMVAVDMYINETTRHAQVILPPTTSLEHDHYDMIFHVFAVRNTAKYSPPLLPKPAGGLHDWEIFQGLAERMAAKLGLDVKPKIPPEKILDMGIQHGPYGCQQGHPAALSVAALKAAPHGVDLGPLKPSLPARLWTTNKKISCAPTALLADVSRAQRELLQADKGQGLLLIGRRDVRSNNSWMHNYRRLVRGKDRCALLMHPQDLKAHRLQDGQRVRISSRVGSLEVLVQACPDMMPGVVSLPHGWGHARPGVQLKVAQDHAGVSANDLTDDQYLDTLSGNAALNGLPVQVEALV